MTPINVAYDPCQSMNSNCLTIYRPYWGLTLNDISLF